MPAQPQAHPPVHPSRAPHGAKKGVRGKPALAMDDDDRDPAQWLGFSLPPRAPHNHTERAVPRRSKRGDSWRGSALTREKFVNASYRFVVKPTETLSYGAHFADPDIALHWPNILQILVPTYSSYSVAQGFVASEDEVDDDVGGESAAERRRRVEEERQGRSCPICLSKPVAGRMTKCGHVRGNNTVQVLTSFYRSFAFRASCTLSNSQTSRGPHPALSVATRYMKACSRASGTSTPRRW